jgi:hypothetical protein
MRNRELGNLPDEPLTTPSGSVTDAMAGTLSDPPDAASRGKG